LQIREGTQNVAKCAILRFSTLLKVVTMRFDSFGQLLHRAQFLLQHRQLLINGKDE
jgi:hypothetical protein